MWYIWKNRNGAVFEHKILLSQVVSSRAAGCLDEHFAANQVMGEALGARGEVSSVAWQRLSIGFVKINVDGGWVKSYGKGAYGVVIRDANGMFIVAAAGCLSWRGSSEIAQAMAVRHGEQMGLQLGLNAVMVESGSQLVIKMINGNNVVSQSVNSIIHDVKGSEQ
ncbi:hypothetical protein RHMOL_Rhmol06G0025700 [Rhododendron molle]|uniref:Uncharacterized protein n=1 Tax=Rhododendron molle TaxID=49168 RepID=A0ACC0N9P5_RHOML|nr:hypothetical protein RHMOL_Rhmol06G0025700 [Rhododendron molle]